jgi:hypothetical protein
MDPRPNTYTSCSTITVETALRESPTWATFVGDSRYNDRLKDPSAEAV